MVNILTSVSCCIFTIHHDIYIYSTEAILFKGADAQLLLEEQQPAVNIDNLPWEIICTCTQSKPTENPESIRKQNDGRS